LSQSTEPAGIAFSAKQKPYRTRRIGTLRIYLEKETGRTIHSQAISRHST
jgi:hypothetical protein